MQKTFLVAFAICALGFLIAVYEFILLRRNLPLVWHDEDAQDRELQSSILAETDASAAADATPDTQQQQQRSGLSPIELRALPMTKNSGADSVAVAVAIDDQALP